MDVPVFGFLLATLAAARVTRLVTTDTITAPLRDPLLFRVLRSASERRAIASGEEVGDPRPWRTWIYTLLTCHWCIGFWICAITVALYHLYGHHLLVQLGAAALAASYVVGWLGDNEGGE